jgi:outer membrane protein TolC
LKGGEAGTSFETSRLHRSRRRLAAALLLVAALAGSGRALAGGREDESNPSAAGEESVLSLSLDEAVRIALETSLALEIQTIDYRLAVGDVDLAKSVFDPIVSGAALVQETKTPLQPIFVNGFFLGNSQTDTDLFTFDAGLSQKVLTGGTVTLSTSLARYFSSQSAPGTVGGSGSTGPIFSPTLGIGLSQPLLQGAGTEYNQSDIDLARRARRIAQLAVSQKGMDLILEVHVAYWNLAFTREALSVRKESLGLAHELLTINQRKLEQGLLAPIDVLQARSQVASSEEARIVAENAVESAEDLLRRLLFRFDDESEWSVSIQPTEAPPEVETFELDWHEQVTIALENRLDLRQKRLELQSRGIEVEKAKNLALPSVAVSALAQLDAADDKFIESYGELLPLEAFTWNAGLTFSYALGNRAGETNVRKAELSKRKAILEMRLLESQAYSEVRDAVRQLNSIAERVDAAQTARDYAWQQYEAERKRFDVGQSTNFQVLEYQNRWLSAKETELRALFDLAIARRTLEKTQGLLGIDSRGPAGSGT